MPTESKKKKVSKSKDEKKPLLLIKNEPDDLKPLEHYVDDRIELIKQIFSTLKTKTVESIIPEFLQEKSIEEIQEVCLEEVLGFSKKRLLSIINATKCPIELKKEPPSKVAATSTSSTQPAKPAEQNGENSEKQYSVLELLELQARARAIRSQLALEPVTKIELDDSDDESTEKEKEKTPIVERPSKSSQNNGGQKEKKQVSPSEEQSKQPLTRPLRLKRNFRQRQMEGYESDENNSVTDKEKDGTNAVDQQTPEKPDEGAEKSPEKESPAKESEPAVVNDDDVVPIIAEPEVLCISSSDSESDEQKSSSKVKKYINMPVVEKVVRPPTEDELFLLKIKEKSEAMNKTDTNMTKDGRASERQSDTSGGSQSNEALDNQEIDDRKMEDGEIVEEDEVIEIPESPEPLETQETETTEKEKIQAQSEDPAECSNETQKDADISCEKDGSSGSESGNDSKSSASEDENSDSDNSESKSKSQTSKKSTADEYDDDIIDLGKDEDLDFEQLEMTHEEPKEETTRRTRSKTKPKHSEKDSPEPKDESWDKRWLRGDKVTKVLATAKLANKVRSKIKEKRTKAATAPKPVEVEPPKDPVPEHPANVEVGSVEHYKELTKQN